MIKCMFYFSQEILVSLDFQVSNDDMSIESIAFFFAIAS